MERPAARNTDGRPPRRGGGGGERPPAGRAETPLARPPSGRRNRGRGRRRRRRRPLRTPERPRERPVGFGGRDVRRTRRTRGSADGRRRPRIRRRRPEGDAGRRRQVPRRAGRRRGRHALRRHRRRRHLPPHRGDGGVPRRTPENVTGAAFEGGTVYVDTSVTDDIEAEGYARDVVRRIQEMRKQLDLDVDEPIRTRIDVDDETVAAYVDRYREFIAEETRTDEFDADADDLLEEWDVEDVTVTIGIERLKADQRAS
ncbi:DUF5915 domain-containing protein [Haloplanus sp. GCM10025708]|uniref:DUF5915 domain-containing protein n=1 Tax=Haloplanus sp. GCM10025708 TaxID=3252679 RepID=UPI00361CE3EF